VPKFSPQSAKKLTADAKSNSKPLVALLNLLGMKNQYQTGFSDFLPEPCFV